MVSIAHILADTMVVRGISGLLDAPPPPFPPGVRPVRTGSCQGAEGEAHVCHVFMTPR